MDNSDEEKVLQSFFDLLRDFDSNMLVIEEYKREMIKRQNTFGEIE
jgi:hypothetical protein